MFEELIHGLGGPLRGSTSTDQALERDFEVLQPFPFVIAAQAVTLASRRNYHVN